MADITDGSAISFCNNNIRPCADKLLQALALAQNAINLWNANNLGTLLPAGGGNVDDNSPGDGRLQMTGDKAYAVMEQLNAFVTWIQASSSLIQNVFEQVTVNPLP